tara:strand:+ start:156 stop:485 length:330 start_codon:yes stop_codon:yes gene_type:complete
MIENIGAVIGWKFNHQHGMDTYAGIITKFPGGVPSLEDQSKWVLEYEEYQKTISHVQPRKEAFMVELPLSDQLDAILKYIKSQPIKSIEMENIINKSDEIKSRFPKEGE